MSRKWQEENKDETGNHHPEIKAKFSTFAGQAGQMQDDCFVIYSNGSFEWAPSLPAGHIYAA